MAISNFLIVRLFRIMCQRGECIVVYCIVTLKWFILFPFNSFISDNKNLKLNFNLSFSPKIRSLTFNNSNYEIKCLWPIQFPAKDLIATWLFYWSSSHSWSACFLNCWGNQSEILDFYSYSSEKGQIESYSLIGSKYLTKNGSGFTATSLHTLTWLVSGNVRR